MQDRIKFEVAIHISGWAAQGRRSSCRILLLSKTLIRGDILYNDGLLFAIMNRCGNFVAQVPQNWRKNRNDDLFACMGMKCPQSVFICLYFEPTWQVHVIAQFVCHMLCSSGRIDTLTCVDARRN